MFNSPLRRRRYAPTLGLLVLAGLGLLTAAALKSAMLAGLVGAVWFLTVKCFGSWKGSLPSPRNPFAPSVDPIRTSAPWTLERIYRQIARIDWYQFERLNAALLQAEGYSVERRGGAEPDGGVDIIAAGSGGDRQILVQCKHWLSWKVPEPVVRELLGAMTHYRAEGGQIRTFKGWTEPAFQFAVQNGISLVDGRTIARDARRLLDDMSLDNLLDECDKRCPKCDAAMVPPLGAGEAGDWSCTRAPYCSGVIRTASSVAS